MTEVIILRHAETEAKHFLKGSTDTLQTKLSDYGLLTTMVTARALRDYAGFREVRWFGFAQGRYRRTTQTADIVEKVVPGNSGLAQEQPFTGQPMERSGDSQDSQEIYSDEYHLHPDRIYRAELLGAERVAIENLQERQFGSLQEKEISSLASTLIQEVTCWQNLPKLLLYGESQDFYNLAKKLDVEKPEWGEGFIDFFKRAYDVSDKIIEIIYKIDHPGEKTVLVLTSHMTFGCALVNALYNSVLAYWYPEAFEGDKKYAKHLLRDYDLQPCHFARLDIPLITSKNGKRIPDCTSKEINDWKHLACIDDMPPQERTRLISEARSILEGSSENPTE